MYNYLNQNETFSNYQFLTLLKEFTKQINHQSQLFKEINTNLKINNYLKNLIINPPMFLFTLSRLLLWIKTLFL